MKTRFFIFTTLCLAVLCLGNAGIAMAQSVTGGGVVQFDSDRPPVNIAVSARTGPAGIVHISQGQAQVLGNVVDLCVVDNAAIVVTQVTQTTIPDEFPEGVFVYFAFQDNGQTGDKGFIFAVDDDLIPCEEIVPSLPDILDFLPTITHRNINITP